MSKSKILIVEDDRLLLEGMVYTFEQSNFVVKTATTTNNAFFILKKFIPEIIILDILLPQKDGFQFLSELKNNLKYKNIPVLVASNLDQPKDKQTAMKLGAIDYIVKNNISLQDLTKIVINLLSV
ncbi:response regulator [Candidatus Shapirobacteria bacterium]|nr:response regulator [Candidatus Shapirobacteria bacterium]